METRGREAEEAVKEEEEDEGPAIKKFKTTWLAFYREYVYYCIIFLILEYFNISDYEYEY